MIVLTLLGIPGFAKSSPGDVTTHEANKVTVHELMNILFPSVSAPQDLVGKTFCFQFHNEDVPFLTCGQIEVVTVKADNRLVSIPFRHESGKTVELTAMVYDKFEVREKSDTGAVPGWHMIYDGATYANGTLTIY